LVVKKETAATNGEVTAAAAAATTERSRVEEEMFRLLRDHFNSDAETKRVLAAFLKSLEKRLTTLSLDDIERICERWNRENTLSFSSP